MPDALHFETPENIRVQYTPAGLGTRFVAWFIDQIFVSIVTFVLGFVLLIVGVSFSVLEELIDPRTQSQEQVGLIVIGIFFVIVGLGSFLYFMLAELLLRGQTIGKRLCKIRVVKSDGFALDSLSILLRNIFRILDHFPPLWLVPVMSARSQRAGDMVGGTLVVADQTQALPEIRVRLSERKAVEAEFRFDSRALQKLTPGDFEAVERLLDRLGDLSSEQRTALVAKVTSSLLAKLQAAGVTLDPPPAERQQRFLEDLLAAELRRQNRLLS